MTNNLIVAMLGIGMIVLGENSSNAQKLEVTLKDNSKPVLAVAFSPDGKTLASSNEDNRINLWNVETGKLNRSMKAEKESGLVFLRFSSDGKILASAINGKNELVFWKTATGTG